jgi:hypothetical protein
MEGNMKLTVTSDGASISICIDGGTVFVLTAQAASEFVVALNCHLADCYGNRTFDQFIAATAPIASVKSAA